MLDFVKGGAPEFKKLTKGIENIMERANAIGLAKGDMQAAERASLNVLTSGGAVNDTTIMTLTGKARVGPAYVRVAAADLAWSALVSLVTTRLERYGTLHRTTARGCVDSHEPGDSTPKYQGTRS